MDDNTICTLRNTSEHALTELNRNNRIIKSVVTGFPFSIPGTELAKHEKIAHVERMKNKYGQETKTMLCLFIGERPDRINLGIWGAYPVRTYYPEPLRCFHCQKFGRHKSACQSSAKCAVCSGRHETSTCINKHKGGEQTHPRCPNCKSNHPAWSRRCPERLNRIKASIPNESERKTPLPKPRKHFYTRAELQKWSTSKPPRADSQKRAPSMTSFNQSRNTPVTLPKTIFCHTDNIRNCFSSFVQVALISANASLSIDKIRNLSQDFMESLWHVSRSHQPVSSNAPSTSPSSSSSSHSSRSTSSSLQHHLPSTLFIFCIPCLHAPSLPPPPPPPTLSLPTSNPLPPPPTPKPQP